MASSWQRPPDTGCDADGIPHGFRKVMGDMAAEMGDDELMRASQGSIHDPRHTSKTFSDIHQKFFGAAKKAGHMALAAQGFREAGERRVMRGVDAHGNSMDYSGGKYARGAKLMLSARAGGPPSCPASTVLPPNLLALKRQGLGAGGAARAACRCHCYFAASTIEVFAATTAANCLHLPTEITHWLSAKAGADATCHRPVGADLARWHRQDCFEHQRALLLQP